MTNQKTTFDQQLGSKTRNSYKHTVSSFQSTHLFAQPAVLTMYADNVYFEKMESFRLVVFKLFNFKKCILIFDQQYIL